MWSYNLGSMIWVILFFGFVAALWVVREVFNLDFSIEKAVVGTAGVGFLVFIFAVAYVMITSS